LMFAAPDEPGCIGIATREQNLKDQHECGPNRGRAAKPWQDEPADHRLDLKQEKCGKKNADCEEDHNDCVYWHHFTTWIAK
jgi:hypothetical protein